MYCGDIWCQSRCGSSRDSSGWSSWEPASMKQSREAGCRDNLGWTFFPRNRPPSSQGWSSRRWRINGLILIVWSGALLTWAIAGFTEVTVPTGLALGWLGFGIGVWVALTKLR